MKPILSHLFIINQLQSCGAHNGREVLKEDGREREGTVGNTMSESLYLIDILMDIFGLSLSNHPSTCFGVKKNAFSKPRHATFCFSFEFGSPNISVMTFPVDVCLFKGLSTNKLSNK